MLPRKYRMHAALLLIALVIIFLPLYNEHPDKQKAAAATTAATRFLQLIDANQFAESWQDSASLLQEKVPEQKWVEQLRKTREVAGPLVTRKQTSISYSTSAKDSPEGEYILIMYESAFKAKADAQEILTVMLDKDQTWRVAGYFIK